ncbi:hypothetical protein FB443_1011032 [Vibrio crassostreae]|uniref:hypothetical protein n=1 Tax=Vibrio crassostreae TaxID=246167 RepID=UPI000F499A59|nr:hypothetical protein [Vibrio crassostreae]ROR87519.1 hypothetical protein EDB66_0450 [Vibrio crassostreae]TQL46088.1 hypothetical protein FB443_1011032 [Vibrio crassostreae]
MRKYFESVAGDIEQLEELSRAFGDRESYWSHLKHREDFRGIYRISDEQKRRVVESLYVKGRTQARYLFNDLGMINHDVVQFPNLTSVIEHFDGGLLYENQLQLVDQVIEICKEFDISLWSIEQMIEVFKEQHTMMETVKVSLERLRESKLFKSENGIEIKDESQPQVVITNNSGSNIVVNSSNVNANVVNDYTEPAVFAELFESLEKQELSDSEKHLIKEQVTLLSQSHKEGRFSEQYKEFTQGLSAHLTILMPFIPALTALIS